MCSNCSGDYEDPDMTNEPNMCSECGHEVSLHGDMYGCQYEPGDRWVTGNQAGEPTSLQAQAPCGCKHMPQDAVDGLLEEYFRTLEALRATKSHGASWLAHGARQPPIQNPSDGRT
jgi:hypothetical protein